MNLLLMTGALLGLLSVIVGAMADHGAWAETMADSVATAIRYHQLGAVMAVIAGVAVLIPAAEPAQPILRLAGWLFVAGIVLFSFSIYTAAFSGVRALTYITPFGGVTMMLAWLALAWAAVRISA